MVKNVNGGTGHKKQASKHTQAPTFTVKLRIVLEEGEVYAQVTKLLGNGMCHVLCNDGKTRLCFIRGKFRGRGKRDNTLSPGKWILIGLRDYESGKKDKMDNCDLLEIYSDQDKDRLQAQVPHINWSVFITNDNVFSHVEDNGAGPRFTDEREDEYNQYIKDASAAKAVASLDQDQYTIEPQKVPPPMPMEPTMEEYNFDDV